MYKERSRAVKSTLKTKKGYKSETRRKEKETTIHRGHHWKVNKNKHLSLLIWNGICFSAYMKRKNNNLLAKWFNLVKNKSQPPTLGAQLTIPGENNFWILFNCESSRKSSLNIKSASLTKELLPLLKYEKIRIMLPLSFCWIPIIS